jgi:hypothetical protein
LQEGGARSAFVSGSCSTCFEKQSGTAKTQSRSTTELVSFCLCYSRALADAISGAEYEAVIVGAAAAPESFVKKTQMASLICQARMIPSAQHSQREREIVALRNECLKYYHPEGTDYAGCRSPRAVLQLFFWSSGQDCR